MVQINWLKSARLDLKEIYQYISGDSKSYAKLQVTRIKERTHVLKQHPKLGKVVREIEDVTIRELVEGNYRIICKIVNDDERINILMVHHGAMSLTLRLSKE